MLCRHKTVKGGQTAISLIIRIAKGGSQDAATSQGSPGRVHKDARNMPGYFGSISFILAAA